MCPQLLFPLHNIDKDSFKATQTIGACGASLLYKVQLRALGP